ncbi:hypothetical protein [Tenacibaculum amylolyticum]|uniref:hypothetical protein n=1 Tax=Tenacibaculum amylolyticum TaxID=104269 RepID=UPI003896811A
MPDTTNSNQYKETTTSQDGKNVMPLLQSNSHFFLSDKDFTQADNQRFGAISESEFRTTSVVSFSGEKNVYAMCQGTVFLQPQEGDNSKVNLILKPFRQPIQGIPIKYIVYRGLNKSDFITSGNTLAGSETSGSGFVQHIWSEFNKFYEDNPNTTKPEFSISLIGFPESAEDQTVTNLIDNYFYKIAVDEGTTEENPQKAYELPTIPKGIELGTATSTFGIDIVLNTGDYYIENDPNPFKLDLTYARAARYSLDTSTITNEFQQKLLKENATLFMDVAAFYGLHTNGGGKIYVGNSDTPLTTKETIFEMLNGFVSKNKTYIYIQANRQRSYNFYNNYIAAEDNDNTVKIGNTVADAVETIFGTNNWPVHEFVSSENGSIALQLTTDNYKNASVYVVTGKLTSNHEENFVRNSNLLEEEVSSYTKPIVFQTETIATNSIGSYISIICEAKQMLAQEYVSPDTPDVVPQNFILKDIDDVFGLLDAKIINTKLSSAKLPTIVDEKLQIINFPNTSENNDIGVIKHQKIEDTIPVNENEVLQRVTYETLLHNMKRTGSSYMKTSTPVVDAAKTSLQDYGANHKRFYQPNSPYYLKTQLFTDRGQTITGLTLKAYEGNMPTKKILGITKEESQKLKDVAAQYGLNNCKVFFINDLYNEDEYFISNEKSKYKRYSISIVGETNGDLTLFKIPEEIKVYSIDSYFFFSENYSKYSFLLYGDYYSNLEI